MTPCSLATSPVDELDFGVILIIDLNEFHAIIFIIPQFI